MDSINKSEGSAGDPKKTGQSTGKSSKKADAKKKSDQEPRPKTKKSEASVQKPVRTTVPVSETPESAELNCFDVQVPEQPRLQPSVIHESQSGMPSELPEAYGDNHIYIMARDPNWIFTYWEIQESMYQKTIEALGGNGNEVRTVLRVFKDTDDVNQANDYATLPSGARQWYINAEADHSYFVEIGIRHQDGRYLALARSNRIHTPRAAMSDVVDEKWMGLDFDTMYALSGGFKVGQSSLQLQQQMQAQLFGASSSGSGMGFVSSMSSPVKPAKPRSFWFVLDCELIVYGATEPDAHVTLQSKPVALRKDGTFSVRLALPDGVFHLDAQATSADGLEQRTIIPIVQRRTEVPEPIVEPTNEMSEPVLAHA